jgi:hypothetical protein
MAMTDVDICNLALGRIGHKETIQGFDEDSQAAQCCQVAYGPTLLALLESSDWGFARKRQTLAALSLETRSGWENVYALPADCLVPRSFYGGSANGFFPASVLTQMAPITLGEEGIPYETEVTTDGNTRVLLCDAEVAELLYTSSTVSPGVFSQAFIQCLAWKLAAELALSLPVKRDLHTNATQQAAAEYLKARAQNLRQRRDSQVPESQFITVRGG